jgi:RNA recognition motif-containing protein
MSAKSRLFIGNLDYNMMAEDLATQLAMLGLGVSNVRIITDHETKASRGFGFFDVAAGEAKAAIEIANRAVINNRQVRVDMASQQPGDKAPPRKDVSDARREDQKRGTRSG